MVRRIEEALEERKQQRRREPSPGGYPGERRTNPAGRRREDAATAPTPMPITQGTAPVS